jgi:hypothetical protein
MLGFGDQISESIAHFIGYFHTSIEAARARFEYREFETTPAKEPDFNDILSVQANPTQYLNPVSFEPDVQYAPSQWSPLGQPVMPWLDIDPIEIDISGHRSPQPLPKQHASSSHHPHGHHPHGIEQGPFVGPGPSETSVVLKQTNHMQDNDVVIMGDKVPVNIDFVDDAAFAHLSGNAFSISEPFSPASVPGSGAELAQFFANQSAFIHSAATGPLAQTPGVTVVSAPAIDGLFVNGSQVASAPDLNDSIPDPIKQTDHSSSQATVTTSQPVVINGSDIVGSVTVQAGANLMVNEVVLQSLDTVSAHFAVAGNYCRIDVVIQTNAYSDTDTFQNGFSAQQSQCQPSTNAMNIANFVQQVDQVQSAGASGNASVFPQSWQITIVSGDLIQMDWISQYSFISDNDMHVLSATGAYTTIVTGGNMAINSASFADLCSTYDLVLIGGQYYDGNFIFQTNILFDNDTFTSGGAAENYDGALSTSDNLLWNAASIQNGDTINWVTGLPDHYLQAMSGLANGDSKMPDGFHNDQNFQGFEGLRVLFISGNVYDLNYIEQVNILGDADYVAHYEDAILTASSDTVWDISTGSNALINVAVIVDNDTHGEGTSYVGGGVYSDAILIQADIIVSQTAVPATGQCQPLANEAVAFLDHETDTPATNDQPIPIHVPDTTHSVDVMQTVLA